MKVSIIIPAFNEEESIERVIEEVKKIDLDKEIIVVDDGSTDRTAARARKQEGVILITHRKNRGRGAAVKTGIARASGEVVYTQDADMEQVPSDIPKLVEPLLSGEVKVVYGCRFPPKGFPQGMSLVRVLGNRLFALLAKLLFRQNLRDVYTGSKCYKKCVIDSIDLKATGFEQEVELLAKIARLGIEIKEVQINYHSRTAGVSKMGPKDGFLALMAFAKYYAQAKATLLRG